MTTSLGAAPFRAASCFGRMPFQISCSFVGLGWLLMAIAEFEGLPEIPILSFIRCLIFLTLTCLLSCDSLHLAGILGDGTSGNPRDQGQQTEALFLPRLCWG